MSDKITVDFKVNSTFSTEVDISEIIDSLNGLTLAQRWNAVAQIINHIEINEVHELNEEQRKIILKWLKGKTEKLSQTITILDE